MNGAPFEEQLLARLRTAATTWSPSAEVRSLHAVTKGSSSLTFTIDLADGVGGHLAAYVKVAPPGIAPTRNRDVLRQAAILRALWAEGSVPVAEVLFIDEGAPPEVPPFFVTAAIAGESIEPLVDDTDLPPATELAARARAAAGTLARLHRVNPTVLQKYTTLPPDLGVHLVGEVRRWERIFATVGDDLTAAAGTCVDRLLERVPEPLPPAIVHGDFRLGNQICRDGRVLGVLDWEIWSVTDPRIDLGWFLMTLSADGLPSAIRPTAPGLPKPAELVAVYQDSFGAEVADLSWFAALSGFRAAAAMALNVKHNRRRPEPSSRIESYAAKLPVFLTLAADRLA